MEKDQLAILRYFGRDFLKGKGLKSKSPGRMRKFLRKPELKILNYLM
jgi:hypothetical protein